MLETAKYLSKNINKEKINKDIIIAFFNFEEEILGFGGSKNLSKELENKYDTVVDINIDCIGLKNSRTGVGYNNSNSINDKIVKEIKEKLTDSSIDIVAGEYSTSDHVNFKNGICLYDEKQLKIIHTVNDTADNLDMEKIYEISGMLGEYIIVLCDGDGLSKMVVDSQSMYSSITIADESEAMDARTCKVIEKNGIRKHISGIEFCGKLDEAEKVFGYEFESKFENIMNLNEEPYIYIHIPNILFKSEKRSNGNYLDKDVKCNIADLYVDEHELNKIYRKEVCLDDVASITIASVNVNKFNDNVQCIYSDELEREKQSIVNNAEIISTIGDYKIYYYYNEMQEGKYLCTIVDMGQSKYICDVKCKSIISTEEDVKNVLEKGNTVALWKSIIEIMEGK